MDLLEALDELNRLLDTPSTETVNTSMRLPVALRDAAALAVASLGVAASTSSLTTNALRQTLETTAMREVLNAHYGQTPTARPSLAEVAHALAAQEGSPLAEHLELLEVAATEVTARHPNADAFDVLLWAEARQVIVG
jgi:hypothetical protein